MLYSGITVNLDSTGPECSRARRDGVKNDPPTVKAQPVKVKNFAEYQKAKGKQWKSKVTKSAEKKEDVVITVGLFEWSEVAKELKPKRGKKLPLTVSQDITYLDLLNVAEAKWRNFYSNLYDSEHIYHLLYEDGQKALLIPGENGEEFCLRKYKDEIGKDYKRITFYLCTDTDLQLAEGEFDGESDSKVGKKDVSDGPLCKYMKRGKSSEAQAVPEASTSVLVVDEDDENQTQNDEEIARELQDMFDAEEISTVQECGIPTATDECEMKSGDVDGHSILASLSRKVDKSSQLFITVRRAAPITRVLNIWKRELLKNPTLADKVVRVHFTGEQGIDSGAMAKEFFTQRIPEIGSTFSLMEVQLTQP